MSEFSNITILPRRGFNEALISWDLPPDWAAADVYVSYSATGITGSYKVLNPTAPVAGASGAYTDTDFNPGSEQEIGFYKLFGVLAGHPDIYSRKVGVYAVLQPHEFGVVNEIIAREFIDMRAANGRPVWHCVPKDWGTPGPMTDVDTGNVAGKECKDAENPAFGEMYQGGFFPPVLTWMRWLSTSALQVDESTITIESKIQRARLMAWPRPRRGHMLVDPVTDRRWMIGDSVAPYALRDIMPVYYEADLVFMHRDDPRYRFDVPEADLAAFRSQPLWVPNNMPYE